MNEHCDATLGCTSECTGNPDCDDGLFCNGAETCVSGGCVAGTPPDCSDGVSCTTDACDETAGLCRNIPSDTSCGVNEHCDATLGCTPQCAGNADCDDGLFCNGAETCVSGGCVAGTPPDCSDGVSCTTDACDETAGLCRNIPSDTSCGVNEHCDATLGCTPQCAGNADCDDGLFCNGAETCVSGGCVAGTPPDCSDGVSCTTDACDETAGLCRNIPSDAACGVNEHCDATLGCTPQCAGNADCDDGLFCNGAETCVSGGCVAGTPPSCGDGVACTVDLCDETGARCLSVPESSMCGASERCTSSGCVALGASVDNPATSCNAILLAGVATGDGTYWVDPDGAGGQGVRQVYCDMTTDGGGWMLIEKNDASSTADATAAEVSPSALSTTTIDTVAKLADAFIAAVQAASTGELRVESPGLTPLLFARTIPWSVPTPTSYPAAIEATTDLAAGYAAGVQCYDGDAGCPASGWCFGVATDATGEHACLRRSGMAGIYFDGGSYPGAYRSGRIWVR